MAVDPPPPLHIPASPYFPFLALRTVAKLCTILAPLAPIGCPIATAPPWMFIFSKGTFSSLDIAIGTTEKASLNSKHSMSLASNPAFLSAFYEAKNGLLQKSTDSISESAYAIIFASGLIFNSFTLSSDIKIRQQAPSLIFEAFAEVIVPFLSKAGFNFGIISSL